LTQCDIRRLLQIFTSQLARAICPTYATNVAAAIEGRTAFVVTGDPDLLTRGEHEGIRIVTPRAFPDLLNR
jgi:predicted nucleic acid-binding protein